MYRAGGVSAGIRGQIQCQLRYLFCFADTANRLTCSECLKDISFATPFGVCLFVISDVNKLKLERLYRSILPFLVPLILTLILVTYIPGIVTALPNALLS